MHPHDAYAARDRLADLALQVRGMVRALQGPNPPRFMVSTLAYFLDGEEYPTTGLTVSAATTLNLVQTRTGFSCEAFFPPELLGDHALLGKSAADGRIAVRLAVRLNDIIQITPLG